MTRRMKGTVTRQDPRRVIVAALSDWAGDYWDEPAEDDGHGGPTRDVLEALAASGFAIVPVDE